MSCVDSPISDRDIQNRMRGLDDRWWSIRLSIAFVFIFFFFFFFPYLSCYFLPFLSHVYSTITRLILTYLKFGILNIRSILKIDFYFLLFLLLFNISSLSSIMNEIGIGNLQLLRHYKIIIHITLISPIEIEIVTFLTKKFVTKNK